MEMSGFLALFLGIIGSRIINERGYRQLSSEDKLRLMERFSATRAFSMIPLLLLISAFWYLSAQTNVDHAYLTLGYFGLLIAYIFIMAYLNQRKLSELQLPSKYRQMFTVAQVVSFVGFAWFFFAIFCNRTT